MMCMNDSSIVAISRSINVFCYSTLPGMWERTVTVDSAGKTFSAINWKLGWGIGPANLINVNDVFCCSLPPGYVGENHYCGQCRENIQCHRLETGLGYRTSKPYQCLTSPSSQLHIHMSYTHTGNTVKILNVRPHPSPLHPHHHHQKTHTKTMLFLF